MWPFIFCIVLVRACAHVVKIIVQYFSVYTRELSPKHLGCLKGILFCSSLPALAENRFADFGRIFSYSVALGGPSLDCLDRSAFDYIANRPISKLDVSQIPDPDVFEQVTKVCMYNFGRPTVL